MDEENKAANIRWIAILGGFFLVLMVAYAISAVRHGTSIFNVFTLVFAMIGAVIVLDPLTTFLKLRKVVYAVTTERILVSINDTSHFSFPLNKVDTVTFLPGPDNLGTLYIGSPAGKVKVRRKRAEGLMGHRVDEGENTIQYPVFYNIQEPEKVKALIESFRNT